MLAALAILISHLFGRWIVKRVCLVVLMAFFVFASVVFGIANWQGTAVVTYFCLAVYYALLAVAVRE